MKTRSFFRISSLFAIFFIVSFSLSAQKYAFSDAWSKAGFKLDRANEKALEISYSIEEFTLTDFDLKGESMKEIQLPGNFLPNNEGAPNLPGGGRFIAVPNGASVSYTISAKRVETYKNVNIAPAPRIPKVTDDGPVHYEKNMKLYSTDAFYPAEPVSLSEKTMVRGVETVILGITPFQYNPVSRELKVYRDLKVEVNFEGGNATFGEERLRSRWFDPILYDMIINASSLPPLNGPQYNPRSLTPDYEYVIIIPDDQVFRSWAEELALFRNMQGIRTGIFTTTEIGGNNSNAIESFVDDAYANWAIPPVAVLLLGDYGDTGNTIISPNWQSQCISDNVYADVSGNHLPDVIFARMTAENESHLETMITKVINYETDPPVDPYFYEHPITALGWQTDRWFQLCSETVGGYFRQIQGKTPTRINAIYYGSPGTLWSTALNTEQVVDYFGPDGVGYIPATPIELGGWAGGNTVDVINAINEGAFILQHRDHGSIGGWGEPDFQSNDIYSLTNTDLSFIFSINCLTGKYNVAGECFAERFHRHTYNGENAGALGLIAASELSYSFVNDVYVWGMFDNMWPDFMPAEQTDPAPRGLLPAFGNAGGKYFLHQSDWPYNTGNKEVTYHLFHHHGCAFNELYSEIPQHMSITHDNVIVAAIDNFEITADDGSFIALSVNGEVIGTGMGTGSQTTVSILPQLPPDTIDVVVTKTNHYRYHARIPVIAPPGPYILQNDVSINDEAGNNNGQMDYGESILLSLEVKNVGIEDGDNIDVTITSDDPYVTITDNQASYGTVGAGMTKTIEDGFGLDISNEIPDMHDVLFIVSCTNGSETWESGFSLYGHSVSLIYMEVVVDDSEGNGNGKLEPGETANLNITIANTGGADAYDVSGTLNCPDPNMSIITPEQNFGEIVSNGNSTQGFSVTSNILTPVGSSMDFTIDITSHGGFTAQGMFSFTVGQMPITIIDLDGNLNSGISIQEAIQDLGIGAEYTTAWPDDLELYSNIFLCLGVYADNHKLTYEEGDELAAFLNGGGKLYMEGGDTWAWDNTTAVHSMFKINGINDGDGDLDELSGMPGTFTEGMTFNYGGDNSYIDRIEAIEPAFNLFENNFPVYYSAVANIGDGYRTIGSTFEFGGLADGFGISSRLKLMEEYLRFFEIRKVTEAPGEPEGNDEVCGNNETVYTTNAVDGADMYYWTILPENAGTVIGMDTSVSILWSPSYIGMASIKVSGMNNIGVGPVSDSTVVIVTGVPGQAAIPDGPAQVNTGDTPTTVYSTAGAADAGEYSWEIDPSNAATSLDVNGTECTVTWAYDTDIPANVMLKVKGVNDCGEGEFSENFEIEIQNLGMSEIARDLGIAIYPNPNKGTFTLELNNAKVNTMNIRVINSTGLLIYHETDVQVSNVFSKTIDISGGAEGMYLLMIESDLGIFSSRILIQK